MAPKKASFTQQMNEVELRCGLERYLNQINSIQSGYWPRSLRNICAEACDLAGRDLEKNPKERCIKIAEELRRPTSDQPRISAATRELIRTLIRSLLS